MPRIRPYATALAALSLAAACAPSPRAAPPAPGPSTTVATGVRAEDVRQALFDLAADSMAGRATGTAGGLRAAVYLAERLRAVGVRPAGDFGFLQTVPLALGPGGQLRLATPDEMAVLPIVQTREAFNVVGLVPGTDPSVAGEVILVGAHYDHLGVGRAVGGDSIYNGADDDASGTVAVLEVARSLARNPARRTVVFFLATGEEVGMLGTRWYLQHPVAPIDSTVAGLFVEMIGRPDPMAGGPGRLWLTGYERSTLGAALTAAGLPIIPDPRPAQNFFERSDNTPFARVGVPAHVLSSFGLHRDYHAPSDEAETMDFAHMTAAVQATVAAARTLADGPRPRWNPGGRPAAGGSPE